MNLILFIYLRVDLMPEEFVLSLIFVLNICNLSLNVVIKFRMKMLQAHSLKTLHTELCTLGFFNSLHKILLDQCL